MPAANHLIREKSPYLLQHAYNPVNWYPWGEEAIARSREEKKVIFLSIGYSTCYWCHVMEKDSFEDVEVAARLNDGFICVKVDREERPDIDTIYMHGVIALMGHGGWPLSIFLTPELKPFFGGTYFPKAQFVQLLDKVLEVWEQDAGRVRASAEHLTDAIQSSLIPSGVVEEELTEELLRGALHYYQKTFDPEFGGFSGAPKFPHSTGISLLLAIYNRTGEKTALKMATDTLDAMSRGGIFDQVGGGFHRYSTDAMWLVPHFEKMLYDNASLASAYFEAYQLSGEARYREIGREVLDYILREMTSPEGGFYSAQDAGEVGKEGEYYVWKETELAATLQPAELASLHALYGVSAQGNFEHGSNILAVQRTHRWEERYLEPVQLALEKLRAVRSTRVKPHTDDKILTSWNGLMISAMCRGYQVTGKEEYLRSAVAAATRLRDAAASAVNIIGPLHRRIRDEEVAGTAFLDDYAFLIDALLHLYESSFDTSWLTWAEELQRELDTTFWSEELRGYVFARPGDPHVIATEVDFTDGSEPSGNAVSARNCLRLFHLTLNESYERRAEELLRATAPVAKKFPSACASALLALDFYLDAAKEVVVVQSSDGSPMDEALERLWAMYAPNRVLAVRRSEGDPAATLPVICDGKLPVAGRMMFFICEKGRCYAPTADIDAAMETIRATRRYEV